MVVFNETDDFFDELFENRMSKTFAIITSGFGTITGLILIYSIIWFERFGSDDKRTLQVKHRRQIVQVMVKALFDFIIPKHLKLFKEVNKY